MSRLRRVIDAQQLVAQLLSGDRRVRIVWSDRGPSVDLDSRTIFLPPMPDELTEEDVRNCKSYVDHETAHVLYTDNRACTGLDPRQFACLNAIEDGVITRKISTAYMGCADNLRHVRMITLAEMEARKRSGETPMAGAYAHAMVALGWMAEGYSRADALTWLGRDDVAALLDQVGDLTANMSALDNTWAAREVACAVIDRWQAVGAPPAELARAAQWVIESSPGAALARAVERVACDRLTAEYVPYTDEDEVVQVSRRVNPRTEQLLAKANQGTGTMRRQLLADLGGRSTAFTRNHVTGTRLDRRRLHRLGGGDPRVFLRRQYRRDDRALALQLVVDHSGSMQRTGALDVAMQLAMAFSRIADELNISCEVVAHTTCGWLRSPLATWSDTRATPMRLLVIQPFGVPFRVAQHAFANALDDYESAHNVDPCALAACARRLLAHGRAGARLVQMVISDGLPESDDPAEALEAQLAVVVPRIEAAGVHVIAIAVRSDGPRRFYRNVVGCDSVVDLLGKGFGELAALLRAARR